MAYEVRISDWSSDVCSSDLSCVVTGLGTWYAAFMGRTFGWNFGEIGLALGLIMGGCGIVGPLISGRSIDAMVRRGRQTAQFLWYGGSVAIAAPAGVVALTSTYPRVFILFIPLFPLLTSPLTT